MAKVGLKIATINALTCNEALCLHNKKLWVTVCTSGNIILTGPKQLKCAEFEMTIQDDIFWAHTCGLGFVECVGLAGFAKTSFRWASSKLISMTPTALGFPLSCIE